MRPMKFLMGFGAWGRSVCWDVERYWDEARSTSIAFKAGSLA